MSKITVNAFMKKAYKRYIAAGMTPEGVCGYMANEYAESAGFVANRVEFLLINRLKEDGKTYTDKTYTAAVDSGKITRTAFLNPRGKQYGYGLCQWTSPSRKAGLYDLAKQRGVSIGDETLALDYSLMELEKDYPKTFALLKKTKSLKEASDYVLVHYEAPANAMSLSATRADYAQQIYDAFVTAEKAEVVGTLQEFIDLGHYYADKNGKAYLEKKTNAYLDDFEKNAGSNNYTKFARDVNNWGQPGCQAQPWCAEYQFWKLATVLGVTKALQIMGGGFYNCISITNHAKASGTWHSSPQKGCLVIFRNGSHVGSVDKFDTGYIYTNEGNTSSAAGVIANGGAVRNKQYRRSDESIDGYVWIDWGESVKEVWKATGTATAKVNDLYVREAVGGYVIGQLNKGNRFEIDGKTSDGCTHVKVANIGIGWIETKYIKKDGAVKEDAAESPEPSITNKQDKNKRLFVGKVSASMLNVRTWAGKEYPNIKKYPTLAKGNLVDVMDYTQKDKNGAKWYFIRIAGKYLGFVLAEHIEKQ